ncbi:MAG: hypothetical protein MUO38_14485, partial [Anaerolineales bacterium]|nr:hypothetical protein [Anaerolineales bacterium]
GLQAEGVVDEDLGELLDARVRHGMAPVFGVGGSSTGVASELSPLPPEPDAPLVSLIVELSRQKL